MTNISTKLAMGTVALWIGLNFGHGREEEQEISPQNHHKSTIEQEKHAPSKTKEIQPTTALSYLTKFCKTTSGDFWSSIKTCLEQESSYLGIRAYRGTAYGSMLILAGTSFLFMPRHLMPNKHKYAFYSAAAGSLCVGLSPTCQVLRSALPILGTTAALAGVAISPLSVTAFGVGILIYAVSKAGSSK